MTTFVRCGSLALAAGLAGCGAGNATLATGPQTVTTPVPIATPTLSPAATPTPQATATASTAALSASPAMLTFASDAPVTIDVTQPGANAPLTESDTCSPGTGAIASVTAAPGSAGGTAAYAVTPLEAGTCTIVVTGSGGRSVRIPVTVSTAAITVQ